MSFRPLLHVVLGASGSALVALGVFLARSPAIPHWPSSTSVFVAVPPLVGALLRGFPATFPRAAALCSLGIIALLLGTPPLPGDKAPRKIVTPWARLVDLRVPISLAVVCALVLVFVEAQNLIQTGWVLGLWLASTFTAAVALERRDRKAGTRLGIDVSVPEVLGLMAASIALISVIYAPGFDSWKFSFIGDEYAFYSAAEGRAAHGLKPTEWLDADGVYGEIPVLTTGIQATTMKLFGINNFGWRLSSALFAVVCLAPLYFLLRHLAPSETAKVGATVGCACFFLSELIIVWARIGKPCVASLPPLVFGLFFLVAARARSSLLCFFLTGASVGLGMHLMILGPTAAVPLVAGVLIYDAVYESLCPRRVTASILVPPLAVLSGFLLVAGPNLVQVQSLSHLFYKNLLSPEDPGTLFSRVRVRFKLRCRSCPSALRITS
jgi:Dolichyl-phosphate-mannose-protein mannosyltransferase